MITIFHSFVCGVHIVYYSEEGGIVPRTREEIWYEIDGANSSMDKNGIFIPEEFGYRIIQLLLFEDGKIDYMCIDNNHV